MPVAILAVAEIFSEAADRLDLLNANPFRVRAYRSAARTPLELDVDLRQLADGRCRRVAGLGLRFDCRALAPPGSGS